MSKLFVISWWVCGDTVKKKLEKTLAFTSTKLGDDRSVDWSDQGGEMKSYDRIFYLNAIFAQSKRRLQSLAEGGIFPAKVMSTMS